MISRATIIISGEVQEAGYRACVLKIARKLGLVGCVENIPDGTVKIICEGEKGYIEKLIKSIKIKTETIEVEDIKVNYEDATGEFEGKGFIAKISDLGQEMFQGYITAEKYFRIGWSKQDKMLDKQDKMLDKQDETLKAIKNMHVDMNKNFQIMGERDQEILKEIAAMHKDTNARFDIMADRYDLISSGLTQAIKMMKDEFRTSRKESATAYNKLAKAIDNIGKLVKIQMRKK